MDKRMKKFLGYYMKMNAMEKISIGLILGVDTALSDDEERSPLVPIAAATILAFEEKSRKEQDTLLKLMRAALRGN